MTWRSAQLAWLISVCVACHDQSPPPQGSAADISKQALTPHEQVDVPTLATTQGTLEPPEGHAIVLTGAPGEVAAQRAEFPELGPTLLAIGGDVKYGAVRKSMNDLYGLGRGDLAIVVRAASTRRIVMIEKFRARASGDIEATAKIGLGATIELNEQPIALGALSAAISRTKPGMVVIVPEPPVTMQQLVEVIAAVGGRAYIGAGIEPGVERP